MSLSAPSYSVTVEKLMTCPAQKVHIADAVNELVLKKEISVADIPSIMFKILVENWNYSAVSYNLESNAFNADQIISDFAKWKAIDIVFMYHHPDLGAIVINPKNPAHKEYISDFRKNEMLVVFVGYAGKKSADALCELAQKKCMDVVYGKKCSGIDKLLKGAYSFKKDAKFDDSLVVESVSGNSNTVRLSSKNGVKNNVVVKPGKLVERSYEQKNIFSIGGKTNPENQKWTYAKYAADMKNQPNADVEDYLLSIAEKTPEKIINCYTGGDIQLRMLFIEAREKGVILKKDGLYLYGEDGKVTLGATDSAVVEWMKQSKNQKTLSLIRKDTYPEMFED